MLELWVQIMDLTFVLRSLKGRRIGNHFWGQIGRNLYTSPSFIYIIEYRNAEGRVNSGDDLSTSCGNLVNFSQVIPEITRLECVSGCPPAVYTSLV